MVSTTILIAGFVIEIFNRIITNPAIKIVVEKIFPLGMSHTTILIAGFLSLALLNILSIVFYRFPVTTTLSFNFCLAFVTWLSGVSLILIKNYFVGVVLPLNSPWYLIPFLAVVEVIRILVRPVTLCFRLLANIRAGHILLTLICKMPVFWTAGILFGLLEFVVCIVQAFVFIMLTRVYLEEAIRH